MRRKPTPPPDIDRELRTVSEIRYNLEHQAGIDSEAARSGSLFPRGVFSDTPFGSEAGERERLEDDAIEHRMIRSKIRRLYFDVTDVDARKAIISAAREVDGLRNRVAGACVQEANDHLLKVLNGGATAVSRWTGPAGAALFVYAIYDWHGIGAALAALAFVVWAGQIASALEGVGREGSIRDAEAQFRLSRKLAEMTYSRGFVFSRS